MDAYKNQDHLGYKDIKLSNIVFDPTFVRAVAYKIPGNYMDCPMANYANVYVNRSLIGIYTNAEAIRKTFVKDHFGSKNNAFFSCSPPTGANPTTPVLPTLQYLGASSTSYATAYEMKSDSGRNDLINLTSVLASTTFNNTPNIEAVLDADRALWMLAFDNLMVNLDSNIGQFKQNYYLYKSDNGRFMRIVWDLNMCFGIFGATGSGGPSLSTTGKQQLSHILHSKESSWSLVQKLLAVPTYKKKYLAHYRTILNEQIVTGNYITDANTFKALILSSVTAIVNKFSYQTLTNMTNHIANTAVVVGNKTAPGLTNLMGGRNTYISNLSDFTSAQPSISNIASSATPAVGLPVTITATLTNVTASSVYLGHRTDKLAIFSKIQMYDDGLHNDGAANDNEYGAKFSITHAFTEYYLNAENANVGRFSPARAEYAYYTLNATYPIVTPGDLVINELMALNTATVVDSNSQYEDWFELYNNTSNTLSLDNLYATDNSTNITKWQFPTGLTVAP